MKNQLQKFVVGILALLGIGTASYFGGTVSIGEQWFDDNAAGVALGSGVSAPDPVSPLGSNVVFRCFDGNASTEQLYWTKEINHDWVEGTEIDPHIHYLPSTNGAGTTTWYLDWYVSENGVHALATGTLSVSDAVSGVAWKSKYLDMGSDINLTGYKIGTQISFRLYRIPTGSDTYADDACVETFGYHYLTNSFGSKNKTTK